MSVPHRGVLLEDPCGVCYRVRDHRYRSSCLFLRRLVADEAEMAPADHLLIHGDVPEDDGGGTPGVLKRLFSSSPPQTPIYCIHLSSREPEKQSYPADMDKKNLYSSPHSKTQKHQWSHEQFSRHIDFVGLSCIILYTFSFPVASFQSGFLVRFICIFVNHWRSVS